MSKLSDILTYDQLYELYINQQLGTSAIAKIFKCSSTMVNVYLRKCGIQIRTPNEAGKISHKYAAETCNLRYGGVGFASKELRDKGKQTKFELYGDFNYLNTEKAMQTKLEKYGDPYFTNPEKAKKTVYKKYGVYSSLELPQCKQKSRSKEALQKETQTKKRNHSFNTSKPEERLYQKLIEQYGEDNVKSQYDKDPRYPFRCDFYIPSKDLFIELNLHWTHGYMPYNPDDIKCQKQLEKWQEKSKTNKFYNNAIDTWTIRDVKKLEYAKKYNLNYKTIYKEE